MTSMIAATAGGDLAHFLPTIRRYLGTLDPAPRPVASFPGGLLLKLTDEHYVAVLLPPCERALRGMRGYFGEHFDGTWQVIQTETYGSLEAMHVTPPWR